MVVQKLRQRFPEAILDFTMAVDLPTVTVDPAVVLDLARYVKEQLGFKLPVLATGTDLKDCIEATWHVLNMGTGEFLAFKARLDHTRPRIASLTPVWSGMDWHEREAFDLLGIFFEDHPDLRRILLPDDWEGHPLRKDYTAID